MIAQPIEHLASGWRIPRICELATLAETLSLPVFAGLEMAVKAGHLRIRDGFRDNDSAPEWAYSDETGRNTFYWECARTDSGQFALNARVAPDSQRNWPIGATAIRRFAAVCADVADTLAVWSLVWFHAKADEITPVLAASTGAAIHPAARPFFRGKGVWVFSCGNAGTPAERAARIEDLKACGAKWVKPRFDCPAECFREQFAAFVRETGGGA